MKIKQKLIKILDGYRWATGNRRKIILGFGVFALLTWLVAWHTDQFVQELWGLQSSYGIPYWIIIFTSGILLLHEADHKWSKAWITFGVGLLCVLHIHYCCLSICWIAFASIVRMPSWVGGYASALILVLSVIFMVTGYLNTKKIKIKVYPVKIKEILHPERIVFLSDLHLGALIRANHVKKLVEKINTRAPDLVIIAGDFIDDDHMILKEPNQKERIAEFFRNIQSPHGVLLTLGNHDPNAEDAIFSAFLNECNIRLLHNEVVEFADYYILGRSDSTRNDRSPIESLLAQCRNNKPVIVVDHNPQNISEAAETGVALVLCGHTHAGQFFPANIAVKRVVGCKRFYGYHIEGVTQTIISSGAGCFNLPIRVGSHNEIVEINLSGDAEDFEK